MSPRKNSFLEVFSPLEGRLKAPPRRGTFESLAIFFALYPYAALAILPRAYLPWLFAYLVLMAAVGFLRKTPYATHGALAAVFALGAWWVPGVNRHWPLPLLLSLLAYSVTVRTVSWLRSSCGWVKWGKPDKVTWFLTAFFMVASAVGVTAWRFLAHPDLSYNKSLFPPGVPLWLLPFGILIYAALNAAFEEILWRGIFMEALESAVGPGLSVLFLQAVGFGLWHYRGFPSGTLGMGLAALFALLMGILRQRSGGLLAPWIAHLLVDAVIYCLVALAVFSD